MNDVLIHTIIEHTKVMFYNFSITLKTICQYGNMCTILYILWINGTSILKYILNRIFMNQI